MAKRKKKSEVSARTIKSQPESVPIPTRRSFKVSFVSITAGLVIQILIAAVTFGSLPAEIPSSWVGWAQTGGTVPSWMVFVAFPGAQLVVLVIAMFSPKNGEGRRVMDFGRAISLILLTVLFTLLQASVFKLAH